MFSKCSRKVQGTPFFSKTQQILNSYFSVGFKLWIHSVDNLVNLEFHNFFGGDFIGKITRNIGRTSLETTRFSNRLHCSRQRRKQLQQPLQRRRERRLVWILWNCYRQKPLQMRMMMMIHRREIMKEKVEHDVVGLYWTGHGGVRSKYYWQSYSTDELCGGKLIDMECLLILFWCDCNMELQSISCSYLVNLVVTNLKSVPMQ